MSKLLWYGETPWISTGAGQVAKHLLPVFQALFTEIELIPINQWWQQPNLPEGLTIQAAELGADLWNVPAAKKAIAAGGYDCLFLTADINRIADLREEIEQVKVPVIMYAAIDSNIYNPGFYKILELADRAVLYSHWAQRLVAKMLPDLATDVIYHGCEPAIFYPFNEEERRRARAEFFGIEDDTFLVGCFNRNQVRKDLARSMAAFKLFQAEHPDSLLYMHAKQVDVGGNLPLQAHFLGLRIHKPSEVVFCPESYNETGGCSRTDLNRLYNAVDVCISTSTGEGWGLTTTECMAAGTPFIGPDNTVFPEILGDGERGLLVESGGPDLWAVFYGLMDTPRELTSVTGMKTALTEVYNNRNAAFQRAVKARRWACEHTWIHVAEQWKSLLKGVLS